MKRVLHVGKAAWVTERLLRREIKINGRDAEILKRQHGRWLRK